MSSWFMHLTFSVDKQKHSDLLFHSINNNNNNTFYLLGAFQDTQGHRTVKYKT